MSFGDEQQFRRPTWAEGTNVVLADGQTWSIPRPIVIFVPADTDVGFEIRLSLDDDGTYGRLLKRLETADDGLPTIAAALAVGKCLLQHNYDLTTDQVADLLTFSFSDDGSEASRIRKQVMDIAWGAGDTLPKP